MKFLPIQLYDDLQGGDQINQYLMTDPPYVVTTMTKTVYDVSQFGMTIPTCCMCEMLDKSMNHN